tara:strand:+ start:6645 stop:6833 length:189 start_codon:yes stop_codon:yes gene_type:complete
MNTMSCLTKEVLSVYMSMSSNSGMRVRMFREVKKILDQYKKDIEIIRVCNDKEKNSEKRDED